MNQYYNNELKHYGVKGMRWGVRKYADKNGKLNAEGRKRYGVKSVDEWKQRKIEMNVKNQSLYAKANKKYKVDEYKKYADQERSSNDLNKKMYENIYGKDTANTYNKATYHNDRYDVQRAKASKFVTENMQKEFGKSYEAWQKENDTAAAIMVGTMFLAGLGITVASLVGNKK